MFFPFYISVPRLTRAVKDGETLSNGDISSFDKVFPQFGDVSLTSGRNSLSSRTGSLQSMRIALHCYKPVLLDLNRSPQSTTIPLFKGR
jgi:hypothetical protein